MRPVAGGVDGADSAEVEHDPDLMGLLVGSGEARGAGGGGFVAGAAGDDPAGGVAEASSHHRRVREVVSCNGGSGRRPVDGGLGVDTAAVLVAAAAAVANEL